MDYSSRQMQPQKHVLGIAMVIAFHAILVYALVMGLGKKIVNVIKQPIETKVIEEIKPPPPPVERLLPPPPKLEAPPPPFIPPPEVQIAVPPPVQNVITSTSPTPPPQTDIRPVAPTAPPAPPAPPAPAKAVSIGAICTGMVQPEMPRKAVQAGASGSVVARATIRAGKVIEVEILRSNPRGMFDAAVRDAMKQYTCSGDHIADQEFVFKLE